MAVDLMTDRPTKLLSAFKKKIEDGEIETWSYDSDEDFTHTPTQWKRKAWLHPVKLSDRLRFTIISSKNYDLTRALYGIYHGRFIEAMLTHCHELFTVARATPEPTSDDAQPTD